MKAATLLLLKRLKPSRILSVQYGYKSMSISDLLNVIELLNESKISTILIVGGIIFLFVAIGGQFGTKIDTRKVNPAFAAFIGAALLVCGLTLSVFPLYASERGTGESPTFTPVHEPTADPTSTPSLPTPTQELPTQTPMPTATPNLLQPVSIERIQFCLGCTSHTLTIDLNQATPRGYVLNIRAGQTLYVSADKLAVVRISDSTGLGLNPQVINNTQWEVVIPKSGDYNVIVGGNGRYTITFYIPPLGSY